ncbi:ACP S-malonyltransferase [Aestuariibacter sp. AA17]|uniref:[acyl-carrier-protein] S-malonyltransferase n=1 Tax=Fluctibacter corallii TaxID=2984329 RepID=A0ABT3AD35_9ALTE|nr:ACP S-malonyltransferase [Aestuariibacter sp. AA17]MCV2886586.1 ACP S-malonyltransferase [Aestuariibacter sp. AA17]
MTNNKQTAVVVCPGRGTYNKSELGYLARFHSDKSAFIERIDVQRKINGQPLIAELDRAEKFSLAKHTAGENASSLIYACAACDFADINRDKYDIVAVTGNSMGWYIALAVANALNTDNAARLINTMGSMMKGGVVGGQLIYPIVDENWQADPNRIMLINDLIEDASKQESDIRLYWSINLGGYAVLGGSQAGLKFAHSRLPMIDNTYPMQLFNHAAFHTPLLSSVSEQAMKEMEASIFNAPDVPLIDGEGHIWQPHSADSHALWKYTLDTQVRETYNFTKAIEVAIKEFAPEKIIVTGPGTTLGGAIGQSLVKFQWQGMASKADFISKQKTSPFLLSMGIPQQRELVI